MDNSQTWEGFSFPDKEYFKIPHNFIEAMSHINNMAELKIVLYVMRHTWGFQEYDSHKRITVDEFMHGRKRINKRDRMDNGTGLSEMSVRNGIAKATEHSFLECEIEGNEKYYRLKLRQEEISRPKKSKLTNDRIQSLRSMPYAEYLQSPEWQEKRKKALRFAGFKCQLCNSADKLNVHHRTYDRLGQELMGDLITLCTDCHSIFHQNRELAE